MYRRIYAWNEVGPFRFSRTRDATRRRRERRTMVPLKGILVFIIAPPSRVYPFIRAKHAINVQRCH